MEIDLFTFVAQVINLVILLFLLRKFLYLPVLKAVEERQKAIAAELEEAEKSRKKALQDEEKCAEKLKEINEHKQEIIAKTQEEADRLAVELNDKAKKQYEVSKENWQKKILAEQDSYVAGMQKSVAEQFGNFAGKAMEQMADAALDELVVRKFMNKLRSLPEEQKTEYANSFGKQKNFLLQTAFEISTPVKKQLEDLLRTEWSLSGDVKFSYQVSKELISGICVQAGEQSLDWSFQKYLAEFKNNVSREILALLNRGEK